MHRRPKQFLYGFFYLAILSLIVGGIFLKVKPAPSCFDGKQNQGEEGIDCGAVCGKVCTETLKSIEVSGGVRILYPDRSHIGFLVKLVNPNLEIAAKRLVYRFSMRGAEGKEVGSAEGVSFIYAGEAEKYILTTVLPLPSSEVRSAEFSVRDPEWVFGSEFGRPRVEAKNIETTRDAEGILVRGEIENRDALLLPRADITAVFFGEFGEIIGASKTEAAGLRSGEARRFEISHPPLASKQSRTAVFVSAARP